MLQVFFGYSFVLKNRSEFFLNKKAIIIITMAFLFKNYNNKLTLLRKSFSNLQFVFQNHLVQLPFLNLHLQKKALL
jgi:hypothetical protein